MSGEHPRAPTGPTDASKTQLCRNRSPTTTLAAGPGGTPMAKPIVLAVDDDAAVAAAVVRDLRARYGKDYRVLLATSGEEALALLADLVLKDRQVAAVISDQRMPGMSGIELLQEVRQQSPDSKLLLLTAYADTGVAIRAINDIGLDYYLMKPWDPPEEQLYPVLDDLFRDWTYA